MQNHARTIGTPLKAHQDKSFFLAWMSCRDFSHAKIHTDPPKHSMIFYFKQSAGGAPQESEGGGLDVQQGGWEFDSWIARTWLMSPWGLVTAPKSKMGRFPKSWYSKSGKSWLTIIQCFWSSHGDDFRFTIPGEAVCITIEGTRPPVLLGKFWYQEGRLYSRLNTPIYTPKSIIIYLRCFEYIRGFPH